MLEHLWIRDDGQPVCGGGSRLDVHRLERRRLRGHGQVRRYDELGSERDRDLCFEPDVDRRGRRAGVGHRQGFGHLLPERLLEYLRARDDGHPDCDREHWLDVHRLERRRLLGHRDVRRYDELGSERDRDLCFEPGDVDGRGRRVGVGHRHWVGHLLPGNVLEQLPSRNRRLLDGGGEGCLDLPRLERGLLGHGDVQRDDEL